MFLAATVCAQGQSITINAAVAFIAFGESLTLDFALSLH